MNAKISEILNETATYGAIANISCMDEFTPNLKRFGVYRESKNK